jgi:KDO2-lipid IV(A) lauroyltransferase
LTRIRKTWIQVPKTQKQKRGKRVKGIKKIRHGLEYGILVSAVFVLNRLPLRWVLGFADALGWTAFSIVRIRRRVTLDNLRIAFPEKTEDERVAIGSRAYRNFAKMVLEYSRFPVLKKEDVLSLCTVDGGEKIDQVLAGGKGAVLVAGHFGNWELMGAALALMEYPIFFLVGEQHNKRVDDMMNRNRERMGIGIIHMGVAVRGVIKALRGNGFVALLSDQDARKEGVFVDFFGRPSSTHQGPAVFALKMQSPIVFGSAVRLAGGRMRMEFEVLRFDDLKEVTPENIRTVTQAYTHLLEQAIRRHPDHWFWMHRRWKTNPPDLRPDPAS